MVTITATTRARKNRPTIFILSNTSIGKTMAAEDHDDFVEHSLVVGV